MKMFHSLALVWLAGILSAGAATWHVATNGVDNSDPGRGESWDLPFATISNAVNAAGDGDTVLVSNGTHAITAAIDVTKNLAIRGLGGNPSNVVVDAGGLCRGFFISGTTNALLSGLTVQHGSNSLYGGGAYIVSTATVENCIFQANRANDSAGGLYLMYGLVSNCQFIANTNARATRSEYAGGGGLLVRRDTRVVDCIIRNNTSSSDGGGAYIYDYAQIVNCTIESNSVTATLSIGGGAVLYGALTGMSNCLVRGNSTTRSGGGVGVGALGGGTVVNSRFFGNTAGMGGGFYWNASGGLLQDCVISNNSAGSGGGVWAQYSTNLIRRCQILNNQSTGNGGGLYSANNSLTIEQCRVQDNIAGAGGGGYGGGIYMTGSSNLVRNCLIYRNTSQNAGGMYVGNNTNLLENCTIVSNVALTNLAGVGGLWCNYHNYSHVINTIIQSNRSESVTSPYPNWRRGNSDVTFSNCCATPTLAAYGAGNITDDPAMAALDAGDCRLLKGSPCINTGLPLDWMQSAADLDGHARLDRITRLVDMGCYEYAPPVTIFYSR